MRASQKHNRYTKLELEIEVLKGRQRVGAVLIAELLRQLAEGETTIQIVAAKLGGKPDDIISAVSNVGALELDAISDLGMALDIHFEFKLTPKAKPA